MAAMTNSRFFSLQGHALACVLWCLLQLAAVPVFAAEVAGLYQATVPVSSREDLRERQTAFATALRQVLLKLSGRSDTLQNPVISRALANAQPYVEAWVYRSQPRVEQGSGEQLVLEASFFRAQIQELLESAGIGVWPENRPDTLLWVALQDAPGLRSLVGHEGVGNEYLEQLARAAAERGLPLVTPILDLQDQMTLRPDLLWSFDQEALRRASARYQVDSILAVRLYPLPGGQVFAKAQHLFRDQVTELDALESSLSDFLAASIGMVASELAANYSVTMSRIDNSTRVRLQVEGITSIADYAGVLTYLQSLAMVQSVQVVRVQGEMMELELGTGGQVRQLIDSMALDRRLLPQSEPVRQQQLINLLYRWQ
jgi:uncharacterized protein